MSVSDQSPPRASIAAITDELVAALGTTVGLTFPAERLPVIAQRLRELHQIAAELDDIPLADVHPAARFDPSWPEVARS